MNVWWTNPMGRLQRGYVWSVHNDLHDNLILTRETGNLKIKACRAVHNSWNNVVERLVKFDCSGEIYNCYKWMNGELLARKLKVELDRQQKILQQLALYFETFARKTMQSWSTVVKISRSRSLFEALKTLCLKNTYPSWRSFAIDLNP